MHLHPTWRRALVADVPASATVSVPFADHDHRRPIHPCDGARFQRRSDPTERSAARTSAASARGDARCRWTASTQIQRHRADGNTAWWMLAGTYLLGVARMPRSGRAEFDMPLGASGPPGPQRWPVSPGASDAFSVTAPSLTLHILGQPVAALNPPARRYWCCSRPISPTPLRRTT